MRMEGTNRGGMGKGVGDFIGDEEGELYSQLTKVEKGERKRFERKKVYMDQFNRKRRRGSQASVD